MLLWPNLRHYTTFFSGTEENQQARQFYSTLHQNIFNLNITYLSISELTSSSFKISYTSSFKFEPVGIFHFTTSNVFKLQYKYIHTNMRPCIKVKVLPQQATKAHRVSRGTALLFLDLGTQMGVGGQHHAPAALPPGKTRYPLYRRLGRPQGRSGRVRKISPPPGFDPRTVQPVASRYTD